MFFSEQALVIKLIFLYEHDEELQAPDVDFQGVPHELFACQFGSNKLVVEVQADLAHKAIEGLGCPK